MSIPAGWYPDPENPAFLRWWDGQMWAEYRYPLVPPQSVPASPQPAYPASAAHTPAVASGGAVPPPAETPAATPAAAPFAEESVASAHAEATVLEPSVEADVPPTTPPVSGGLLSTPVPIQIGNGNLPTKGTQEKAANSSFNTGERLGGLHGSSRSDSKRSASGGASSARSSSRSFSSIGEVVLAVISVVSLFTSAVLMANYLQRDRFLRTYQEQKEVFEKEYETLTEGLPILEQVLSDLENR